MTDNAQRKTYTVNWPQTGTKASRMRGIAVYDRPFDGELLEIAPEGTPRYRELLQQMQATNGDDTASLPPFYNPVEEARLDMWHDIKGMAICDMCFDDFSEKQAVKQTLILDEPPHFVEATLCPQCARIENKEEIKP